jgi:hypothetical protein
MREARMEAEPGHRPSMLRDAAGLVERAEPAKKRARLRQRRRRRRIEEGEVRRRGAPAREVEGERREIGGEDLRFAETRQQAVLALAPQPVADAGPEPPGAAAPLVGGGLRDLDRLEPRHPAARLEARHAHEPAIDDHADALDGEAGLGDRGRQHDLAHARRCRQQRCVLRRLRQLAIERRDADRRS